MERASDSRRLNNRARFNGRPSRLDHSRQACGVPVQIPNREDADKELVDRSLAGDRTAFRELVLSHERAVFGTIATMVNDPLEADDIAQEVFIKVHRSLKNFRGQSRFSVWLYRITINQCLDRIKHRKRRPESSSLDLHSSQEDDHLYNIFEDPSPSAADVYEDTQLQTVVRGVLAELSPEHRTVVALKDLEGRSQEEIAEILECPIGTVKSRLTRAREALKDRLRPFYEAWRREEA